MERVKVADVVAAVEKLLVLHHLSDIAVSA